MPNRLEYIVATSHTSTGLVDTGQQLQSAAVAFKTIVDEGVSAVKHTRLTCEHAGKTANAAINTATLVYEGVSTIATSAYNALLAKNLLPAFMASMQSKPEMPGSTTKILEESRHSLVTLTP